MGLSIIATILGLAVPVGLVAAVVLAIRRRGHADAGAGGARGVRRFFQYLLLLALMVLAAIGVADLLGRLLGGPAPGDEALARTLAFTLVGVPLALLLAWWTRRSVTVDPEEATAAAYAVYLTMASLLTLLVGMVALQAFLAAALRASFDGAALAQVLVWGGLWALHWRLGARALDPARSWPHLLLGSLVGLGTAVVALGLLLGASLEALLLDGRDQLVVGTGRQLAGFGAALAVGALVWVRYWATGGLRLPRTVPWLVAVLPIGVGGGLVLAVSAASVLLWQVLVWVLGDPAGTALRHFADAPTTFAFAVTGLLVWWYHRTLLGREGTRTEVDRVHEYLVAAIGLLAAAAGVGMVLVALIESFTPGLDLGVSVVNTLLGAVTLLVVGTPLWWVFWSRIRRARAVDPVAEVASPTRRTYLVLLFGIAGVAAVIALVVAVFVLLQDILAGTASGETIRSMRYALGVLLSTAAVSAYHGAVYREDRTVETPPVPTGPRWVLLVGPTELAHELRRATGARIDHLAPVEESVRSPSEEALLAELVGRSGQDLVVVADGEGLRVIPVHGRR